MGFITTINPRTGREVYACEFSKEGCQTVNCKALKCPYGYCQRYYACPNCQKKVKGEFKKAHATCKVSIDAYNKKEAEKLEILEKGLSIRTAALSHENGVVRVVFRDKDGKENYTHMMKETYDAIPLGANATIEDYEKVGHVKWVSCEDIYKPIALHL